MFVDKDKDIEPRRGYDFNLILMTQSLFRKFSFHYIFLNKILKIWKPFK